MITVEPVPFENLLKDAVSGYPDECCGFLYGRENTEGDRTISTIRVVNNAKDGDKRRRFAITSKDYMQAERFAQENELILLGVYHSHPGHPAIPSEHDRVAALPYFSYIIISVMQGQTDDIRSWRLNEDSQFEEETYSPFYIKQIN